MRPFLPKTWRLLTELLTRRLMWDMHLMVARHAAAVEHVLSRTMLDSRTVAAYRAYALNGESAADVAARLGITPNALRQIKFRIDRMIAAVEAAYGE